MTRIHTGIESQFEYTFDPLFCFPNVGGALYRQPFEFHATLQLKMADSNAVILKVSALSCPPVFLYLVLSSWEENLEHLIGTSMYLCHLGFTMLMHEECKSFVTNTNVIH